jgi:hypothetical protein
LLKDEDRQLDVAGDESPEQVFMRQWAHAVMARVCDQLRKWCHQRGRPEWYEVFSTTHISSDDSSPVSQQALAERLNLTRDQIRYALAETKREFSQILYAEVSELVASPAEIEAEIKALLQLLGD